MVARSVKKQISRGVGSLGASTVVNGKLSAVDFANDNYVVNDYFVAAGAAYTYAGGPVLAQKLDNTFQLFAANTLPKTDKGVQLEIAAKRMTPAPVTPFTDWSGRASSPGVTAFNSGTTYAGIFANGCRVSTAGSIFAYVYATAINAVAIGDVHQCTWVYAAGTSGKIRVVVRLGSAGSNECRLDALVGSNSFVNTANAGTGAFTNVSETKLGTFGGIDIYVLRATMTYTAAGVPQFCIGPQSTTAGQDIIVFGGQLDNGVQSSWLIIGNPTGEFQRAASVLTLLNAAFGASMDVCATFDDDGRQMFSGKTFPHVLDPTTFRRKSIKKLEAKTAKKMKEIVGSRLLGSSIDTVYLPGGGGFNQTYYDLVKDQVSLLVAEGSGKAYIVFPNSNMVPDWSRSDAIWNLAQSLNIPMREHVPVWYVNLDGSGTYNQNYWMKGLIQATPSLWKTYMDQIIAEIVPHRPWRNIDVCNEVLSADGSGGTGTEAGWRTDSTWFIAAKATDGDGRVHVYRAFEKARIANPKAKLYLCDYAQERYPAKGDAFLTLAQDLKARGTIDGVNFQSHLFSDVNYDYSAIQTMFANAAGMGLEVGISEFDIRNGSLVLTATQKKLLAQEVTFQYFSAALKGAGAALKDVLFWGMADTQSWTQGPPPFNNTTQYPLPFDSSYSPNPMLEGFKAAFFNS